MSWRVGGSPDRVLEWTTITADHTIHDQNSPTSESWLNLLCALKARKACEGCEGSYWSRVIEQRDNIWIWTFWTTRKNYEQYRETEQHYSFLDNLTLVSTTTPTTQLLVLSGNGLYSKRCLFTGGWPSATLVYFNGPISEEQRAKLEKSRGMSPYWTTKDPPKYGTSRGFIQSGHENVVESTGSTAEVYVIIDWWADPIREDEVRKASALTPEYPGEHISLDTMQERQLGEAGCVERIVRHARFSRVLDLSHWNETMKGENLDFTKERWGASSRPLRSR